ncbi:hypothetical protein PHYSODRAFT_513008, partial [Phytophthora sojae]
VSLTTTLLPTLTCVALVDAFPLESPDLGLAHSGTLWIRGMVMVFLNSYALSWQFNDVPIQYQPVVALIIPIFKITQKNIFCQLLRGKDDLKPEMIIFNIEISNAFFISSNMQRQASINTSILLIVIDLVHMVLSLCDLILMLKSVEGIVNKMGITTAEAVAVALTIATKYPEDGDRKALTDSVSQTKADILVLATFRRPSNNKSGPTVAQILPQVAQVLPIERCTNASAAIGRISTLERHLLLDKVLQIMFFTEFILLTEFIEVFTPVLPVAQCCFLVILYYWPNRRFYSQLEGLDDDAVWFTIGHIQLYGILEVVLFVVLIVTLHKMAYKSPLQQLAYAVNRNWGTIQCKLVIWLLVLVHSTIPQLGTLTDVHIVLSYSIIMAVCV